MKTLFRTAAPLRAMTLGALVAAGLGAASAASAQTAGPAPQAVAFPAMPSTLSLSAYGETRVAPDMATITLGVQTDAPTAGDALKANAARMTQVIAALKKGGVSARDIQTSGLNVNPQYAYKDNEPPRLTGYQVSNTVTVTVRDLTRLGDAVDATVNAGANTVGGVSFGLQDPSAAEDAARLEAVKALQHKADLYARATGYRIVRLVNLNEGGGYAPTPPMPVMMVSARFADKASTPVEAGENRVRIDITASYEIAR